MPENDKKQLTQDDYRRTERWLDFTIGPGTLELAAQPIDPAVAGSGSGSPAGENVVDIGDPRDFDENFPIDRPDVPDIEEQLPEEAERTGFLGGFRQFMDNIWFDDLGGNLRGESGWLQNVPLYEETVGNVFDVALTSGSTAIDTVNWGSDQLGRLITAAVSAAPGGIQTLTWDETKQVSPMQAAITAVGLESKRIREGGARPSDVILFTSIATMPFILAGYAASDSPIQQDGFDILNEKQKNAAFSQGWEKFFSGLGDAGVRVGTDPLIILGGAGSFIRAGSAASKFGGLTNQNLRTSAQIDRFGSTLDDQARLIEELGVDGARSSGRLTNEGENLIRALQNDTVGNANHVWVKNSNNERAMQDLLGRTSVDNPREAAAMVGALAGRATSWRELRELNPQLYDDVALANGFDLATPLPKTADVGKIEFLPEYSDDTIKLFDDVIKQAEDAPSSPLIAGGPGGQVLQRGGSRGRSTPLVRAANAWRQGATRTQFKRRPFGGAENSTTMGKNGGWVYDFIEGTSASRPITAVRWVGRGVPSGVVFLKGEDLTSSNREWSAWLRKSPLDGDDANFYYTKYVSARTVEDRRKVIEEAQELVVANIATKRGVSVDNAMKLYNGYMTRQAWARGQIRKSETKFYIDDQTGEVIKVPEFYGELDQAFPLLDVKLFSSVVGKHSKWLRSKSDITLGADYINSLWKVSVLLRLGYTQRNVIEGALRSFAVLGLIASNPKAWYHLPANAVYNAQSRKAARSLRNQEQLLMQKYDDLEESKRVLMAARSDAKHDDWDKLQNEIDDLGRQVDEISKGRSRKDLSKKQRKTIDQLVAKQKRRLEKQKKIQADNLDPAADRMAGLLEQQRLLGREIEMQQESIDALLKTIREKTLKRKRVGVSPNRMSDGSEMPGAFMGDEGSIARMLSSADRTQYATFQWGTSARAEILGNGNDFKRLDPAKLSPEQMQTYWAEYVTRINNRYRRDPIARMILEGKDVDYMKRWLTSPEGRAYRQELSIEGRSLDNVSDIDVYLSKAVARLDNEVPNVGTLRQRVLDSEISRGELMTQLGGRDLPVILGRLADDQPLGLRLGFFNGLNKFTDRAMKILGTIPEDKLLRHPFYNNIYTARQRDLWESAYQQGLDMNDPKLLARLNRSAHRDALKATRETMYTVERLSNAGEMLRFISPFFPAYENAIRTWGRIVYQRPQVLGYGNILWNIPNNLGWVVDENGNKVESSNFLKDEGHFVIWPEPVQKFMNSKFGFVTPGQAIMSRQGGMNVVFPGGAWWFPGVGPLVQISSSQILRGRPGDQEILKAWLGEEVYNQVTPFGNVNNSLVQSLMPTAVRRWDQMRNGTTADSAYLTSYNQILEDAYIEAQIENRTLTQADYAEIDRKANNFWKWQIGAAAIMPFQSKQMSKYQLQRDKWNQLIDDESIPYPEKIRLFLEDQGSEFFAGEDFAAITRSGSFNETKLNPNLATWERITKNKDRVKQLYDIDPELVGMFGNMGSWDDPFSYAVYGEYGSYSPGQDGKPVRRKLRPEEIARNNEVRDGWSAYWKVKDYAEEKAIQAGLSSLQVDEAAPLRKIIDDAVTDLSQRYPAWGQERQIYNEKLPTFILGARMMVQDAELVDEDPTIRALSTYLSVREEIVSRLDGVSDPEVRKQLKQVGYAAAFDLRQQDIGFADFYDQYLARDDFRKV